MKKLALFLGLVLIALLAWEAAGPSRAVGSRAIATPPRPTPSTTTAMVSVIAKPSAPPPNIETTTEHPVPADVSAPIAPAIATMAPLPEPAHVMSPPPGSDTPRPLIIPVATVTRSAIRDMFDDARGGHRHEAIDIMAPRGTPVIAADDGVVKKLFTSVPGGLTVYEFDPDERFCYYYAHLDRYAAGLHEGQPLQRGEVLGYVGTTGNAPKNAPHLHFALIRLDPDRRWWKGTYVNPYPLLAGPHTP